MDKARQQALDLISRTRKDIDKILENYQAWELNYWNKNQDELKKQGWNRTPSSNFWGSTWSKTTPVILPKPKDTPVTPVTPVTPLQNDKPEEIKEVAKVSTQPTTTTFTLDDYKNSKFFRHHHFLNDNAYLTIDGKKYPMFVTQNLDPANYSGPAENDRTYVVDPETGKIRKVLEDIFGMPYNMWSKEAGGLEWFEPEFMYYDRWLKENPRPMMHKVTGGYTQEYENWLAKRTEAAKNGYKPVTNALKNKQGGTMNRINYFQQGGAAPQQDMQKQVVALVQAAMQGDQKATQTVNQIIEAAKAGDQKAVQLAQMIQQVVQKMKGQATAAKWGSKLSYIRSLKYANGGKACPACQAGAPIKPVKKVEEKACGGKAKKAKKRYFGGWL